VIQSIGTWPTKAGAGRSPLTRRSDCLLIIVAVELNSIGGSIPK